MKKVIAFTTVLCFLALSATEAQINKGRMLAGISTSFSNVNYGSDIMSLGFTSIRQKSNAPGYVEPPAQNLTTFNLSPRFGYFVINNLAVGIDATIASAVQKESQYDSKFSMTYLGLGPFVRYYISGNKVMPFFEASGSFGSIIEEDSFQENTNTYKTGVRNLGAGVGVAVRLSERLTFDMLAGYNSTVSKSKTNNPDDERTVQGTIGFKFGFVVLLGSK
jgi:Outer membrane protein beta-barrel domain